MSHTRKVEREEDNFKRTEQKRTVRENGEMGKKKKREAAEFTCHPSRNCCHPASIHITVGDSEHTRGNFSIVLSRLLIFVSSKGNTAATLAKYLQTCR